jgi:hypothetical protein
VTTVPDYSARFATSGSTLADRRAGTRQAASTTTAWRAATATNVVAPAARVPTNVASMPRVSTCPQDAQGEARRDHARAVGQDAGEEAAARGAERHAHPELAHAPRHRAGDNAEEADGGEHQPLGRQLTHETRAAGADRRSDRHLALALHRAGEQQIGDVEAGEQQHEAHRAHGDPPDAPEPADLRMAILPWRRTSIGQ